MFVPEGLVVHVEQYIKQKKKEYETKYETSNQSQMTRQRSTPVDVHGHSSLPSISQQHYSSPPINEHHFTIGSMVVIPTEYDEPLHGVIMWIGTVPGKPGLIAGVELVSFKITADII